MDCQTNRPFTIHMHHSKKEMGKKRKKTTNVQNKTDISRTRFSHSCCYNGYVCDRSWRNSMYYYRILTVALVALLMSTVDGSRNNHHGNYCSPCPASCACPVVSQSPLECAIHCSDLGIDALPTRSQVPPLDNIVSISLYDNPYVCECDMAGPLLWLSWQQQTGKLTVERPEDTKCSQPEHLEDQSVMGLTLTDLGCAAQQFASCTWSAENAVEGSLVVFSSIHGNVNTLHTCQQTCFRDGTSYGVFSELSRTCLCGDIGQNVDSSCSCTDATGAELATGAETCSYVYIRSVWPIGPHLSFSSVQPFSSQGNVEIAVRASLPFEEFYWTVDFMHKALLTQSGTFLANVYHATSSVLTVEASSHGQLTAPLAIPLRVLDPVVIEVSSDIVLYADAEKNLKLQATVLQGTDFRIDWTHSNDAENIVPETFCPSDWIYINKRCVGMETAALATYDDALAHCESVGGSLLETKRPRELQQTVTRLGLIDPLTNFYIGAVKNRDNTYHWQTGGKTTYFDAVNVTNNAAGQCVCTSGTAELVGSDCSDLRPYICQKDPVPCPSGGVYHSELGLCYQLIDDTAATYQQAMAACEEHSGQLVDLPSQETAAFLHDYISTQTREAFWIGLNDLEYKGHFMWSSGMSLRDTAPWATVPEVEDYHQCVTAMIGISANLEWQAQACDTAAAFVCQHSASERTHNVQGYIAGQPGAIKLGPSSSIAQTVPSQDTTLEGSTVLLPECSGAIYPFAVCSTSPGTCTLHTQSCTKGKQYCPVSQSCISVHDPCTCAVFSNSSACSGLPHQARRKRRSVDRPPHLGSQRHKRSLQDDEIFPSYEVKGRTVVLLTAVIEGLIQVSTGGISVSVGDVIGFQLNSAEGVVSCSETKSPEWIQQTLSKSGDIHMMKVGDIVNTSGFTSSDMSCGILARYFEPVTAKPSSPFTDEANFNVGIYNITVTAQNAVSQSKSMVTIDFQKRIRNLKLLINDQLYQPNPPQSSVLYVESSTNSTAFVGISKGTNAELYVMWPDSNTTKTFTANCPTGFTETCVALFSSSSAKFVEIEMPAKIMESPKSVPVTFIAANKVNHLDIQLLMHVQDRIQDLKATSNVFAGYATLSTSAEVQMDVSIGSDVEYEWRFPGIQPSSTGRMATYAFNITGVHNITGTACNQISCETDTVSFTVIQPGDFDQPVLSAPSGAYVGDRITIDVMLTSEVWAAAQITVNYGDGTEDSREYLSGDNTVNHCMLAHIFHTASEYNLKITIQDVVSGEIRTSNWTINICERPQDLAIIGPSSSAVSTEVVFYIVSSGVLSSPMEYLWNFGDSSQEDVAAVTTMPHMFNTTGSFDVTVTATTCAGNMVAMTTVIVQEPISSLAIECEHMVQEGAPVTVSITRAKGTHVTLDVDVGDERQEITQAGLVEVFNWTSTQSGTYNISVHASNDVSSGSAWVTVYVLTPTTFEVLGIQSNSYVPLGQATTLEVQVLHFDPSSLIYSWDLVSHQEVGIGKQVVTTTFTTAEVFTVRVTVLDGRQVRTAEKVITVEEILEDLIIQSQNPLYLPFQSQTSLEAKAIVMIGRPVTYTWHINGIESTSSDDAVHKVVHEDGTYRVSVVAANHVSQIQKGTIVDVYEEVTGLAMVTNNLTKTDDLLIFQVDMKYTLQAMVISGTNVTFIWDFEGVTSDGSTLENTFTSVGDTTFQVQAANAVNQTTLTVVGRVEEAIRELQLVIDQAMVTIHQNISVQATTSTGSNITYEYSVCQFVVCTTTSSKWKVFTVVFPSTGVYDVQVTATNDISFGSSVVRVQVYPELIILIQNRSDVEFIAQNEQFTVSTDWPSNPATSYKWQVRNESNDVQFQSSDATFKLSLPTLGKHTVLLEVSVGSHVKLSQKTFRVIQEVGNIRIESSVLEEQFAIVNHTYNFTAYSDGGSSLQYIWTLSSEDQRTLPDTESIVYQFLMAGKVDLVVNVSNPLGYAGANKVVLVEDVISGITINTNASSQLEYAPLEHPVMYSVDSSLFWPVQYKWKLTATDNYTEVINDEIFTFTFNELGTYDLTLLAWNDVSEDVVEISVTVQEAVAGLAVHPRQVTISLGEKVHLTASHTAGTDVVYTWKVGDIAFTTVEPEFEYTFTQTGAHRVGLTAANNVSQSDVYSTVQVTGSILGLHIVDCCETVYETSTMITFQANVLRGGPVFYNWTLELTDSTQHSNGTTFSVTFLVSGVFKLMVTATNLQATETISEEIQVQREIDSVHLEVFNSTLGFYVLQDVTFVALPVGGNPVQYEWHIEEATGAVPPLTVVTQQSVYIHKFWAAGYYLVSVEASNNVSSAYDIQIITINTLICEPPVITLVGEQYREVQKSQTFSIEAYVEACSKLSLEHRWTIYNTSCNDTTSTPAEVVLPESVEMNAVVLDLPARSLNIGYYCLHFDAKYIKDRTGPSTTAVFVILRIIASPLQAIIKGGNEVTADVDSSFYLDGSLSFDPDLAWGEVPTFSYLWQCVVINPETKNATLCFEPQNTSVVLIPPRTFMDNQQYLMTLEIYEPGRMGAHTYQKVVAQKVKVTTANIDCVSCRDQNVFNISKSNTVKLLGECLDCDSLVNVQWKVSLDNGTEIPLDNTTTTTGGNKMNLVMKKGSLVDGLVYHFSLNVTSLRTGYWGYAKLTLHPSLPPSDGTCEAIHPQIVTSLDDLVYVQCTDWIDHSNTNSPLLYHIYVTSPDGQWYPIYKGTKNSIMFVMSPFAEDREQVQLAVEIIDQLGMSTMGLRKSIVLHASQPEGSKMEFLTMQIYEKLPIVQHSANHKLIMGYVISILLELNRETASVGDPDLPLSWSRDVEKRIEMRRELFEVINDTMTISSLDDVQQTGYALKLLTLFPFEVPKSNLIYKTVEFLLNEIITYVSTVVSQAWQGEEFVPYYHLVTIGNMIDTIKYDLFKEQLILGDEPHSGNHPLYFAMENMFSLSSKITNLILASSVADEDPYHYDLGSFKFSGSRVMANKIIEHYAVPGCHMSFPPDLMSDLPASTELFQTVEVMDSNPVIWGFTDNLAITTSVVMARFCLSNGSLISVEDLPNEKQILIASSQSRLYSEEFWERVKDFLQHYVEYERNMSHRPFEDTLAMPIKLDTISFPLAPKQSLSSRLNTSYDLENGGAIGLELSVTGLQSAWGLDGSEELPVVYVLVGTNYVPHMYQYDHIANVTVTGNRTSLYSATLSLDPSLVANNEEVYVTVTNNDPSSGWNITIGTFLSVCQYYDPSADKWSSYGCQATVDSHSDWTVCNCNHMTMYGSSVYFSPNELKFEDLLSLNFSKNPVVISLVCVLAAIVLVALVLARYWDRKDLKKISRIPVCGKTASHLYEVTVITGRQRAAGTSANVGMRLYGSERKSSNYHLTRHGAFKRASRDTVIVANDGSLGNLWKIRIWQDNSGLHPSWYLSRVVIRDMQTNQKYEFLAESWFSLTHPDYTIEKCINVAGPEELHSFQCVFQAMTSLGFSDHHIFVSVFDCPPHTTFTRVQRVVCCATYLYSYILANAIWFGLILVPSDYEKLTGDSPLQWNDVFVGFMASLMVLPVMLVLVQMFRLSKHKTSTVGPTSRRPSTAQTVEMDAMISMSSRGSSAVSRYRGRHRLPLSVEDLDGTSSSKSVSAHAGRLHRTFPLMGRMDREPSMDISDSSSVYSASSHANKDAGPAYWSNDGILAWPDNLPELWEGDSRQSSASSSQTRFLHRGRVGSGKSKRRMSVTASEMMELEEIEEVDDLWEDSNDESPANDNQSNNKTKKTVKNDTKDTGEKKTRKDMKKVLTPRTEADIEQLIEEIDAAIESDAKGRPKNRAWDAQASHSSTQLAKVTNTQLDASCANITIECAACSDQTSTSKHLYDHTCQLSREVPDCSSTKQNPASATQTDTKLANGVSREPSECSSSGSSISTLSRRDSSIDSTLSREPSDCSTVDQSHSKLAKRDSLTRYSGLRRPSFTQIDREAIRAFQPLQPAVELASASGGPCNNLWAWSRSSTWIEPGYHVAVSPQTETQTCRLPHWCVYLAYTLCALVIALSVLLVLMYGHQFGRDLSIRWLLACLLSIVLSAFILEPIKVVLIALFVASTRKTVDIDVHRSGVQPVLEANEKIKDPVKIKPMRGFALLQAKEEGKKLSRMYSMLYSLCLYTSLLVLLLLTCYIYHSQNTYLISDHVNRALLDQPCNISTSGDPESRDRINFHHISRTEEMWQWLQSMALPWLHRYDMKPSPEEGTLKLIGRARLRQIRTKSVECPAYDYLIDINDGYLMYAGCYGGQEEDQASYGNGWNDSTAQNHTWFFTPDTSQSLTYFGNITKYPGGGYIQELGSTIQESSLVLDKLHPTWIDRGTRAVLLEFTQFNPNVDLYLVARVAFEFPTSGGVFTSQQIYSSSLLRYKSGIVDPIMVLQVILSMVAVWLCVHVLTRLIQDVKAYVKDFWNCLELCVTAGLVTSLCLYIRNVVVHTRQFEKYFNGTASFVEFTREAHMAYIWRCLNAVLLFILMLMLARQLRFIKRFSVYVDTLYKARPAILGCALFFWLGVSMHMFTGFMWYGNVVYAFRSLGDTFGTVIAMFRSTSPYFDEMLIVSTHFTTFFVLTLNTFFFVIVFGLILAAISDSYRSVKSRQNYHSTVEMKDYEMVDFMMNRFKLLIGTKKKKPAFRRVKFEGLPSLSSSSFPSTRSSSQTRSPQSSSTASTTSSDFSWPEWDINTVLDQATTTWDRLLDKLEQVEASERDEEILDRQVVRVIGSLPVQHKATMEPCTKGKTSVHGNTKPKITPQNVDDEEVEDVAEVLHLDDETVITEVVTGGDSSPVPNKSDTEPTQAGKTLNQRSLSASVAVWTPHMKEDALPQRMVRSADRPYRYTDTQTDAQDDPVSNAQDEPRTEEPQTPRSTRKDNAWVTGGEFTDI